MAVPTLEPGAKSKHIDSGGVRCPFCAADTIEAGPPDYDEFGFRMEVRCSDCGHRWNEIHTLADIEALDDEE